MYEKIEYKIIVMNNNCYSYEIKGNVIQWAKSNKSKVMITKNN